MDKNNILKFKQHFIVGIVLIVLFIAILIGYYWLTMRNQETSPANNEDLIDLFDEIPNDQIDTETNYPSAPHQPPQKTSVDEDAGQGSLPWLDGPSDTTNPSPGGGSGSGGEPWNQGPSN